MKRKIKVAVTASRLVSGGLRGYFLSPTYSRAIDNRIMQANINHLLELYDEAGRR